jgi:protein-disulfide isomerase
MRSRTKRRLPRGFRSGSLRPNPRHAPKIREDFRSGVRSGVNGTPTFFINGVRHDGGYDLTSLLEAVQL